MKLTWMPDMVSFAYRYTNHRMCLSRLMKCNSQDYVHNFLFFGWKTCAREFNFAELHLKLNETINKHIEISQYTSKKGNTFQANVAMFHSHESCIDLMNESPILKSYTLLFCVDFCEYLLCILVLFVVKKYKCPIINV